MPTRRASSPSGALAARLAAPLPARTARITPDLGHNMGPDQFVSALLEPDAVVSGTVLEGLELCDLRADGTLFQDVEFRGCAFDHLDLSNCTFRDVSFRGCRLDACDMGRCWLDHCDFVACAAPGLGMAKSRVTDASLEDCQLSYLDLGEATLARVRLSSCSLREAGLHHVRLSRVELEGCDLSRASVFHTPLAGMDLSTCRLDGIALTSDLRDLRGAILSSSQAEVVLGLLGIQVRD